MHQLHYGHLMVIQCWFSCFKFCINLGALLWKHVVNWKRLRRTGEIWETQNVWKGRHQAHHVTSSSSVLLKLQQGLPLKNWPVQPPQNLPTSTGRHPSSSKMDGGQWWLPHLPTQRSLQQYEHHFQLHSLISFISLTCTNFQIDQLFISTLVSKFAEKIDKNE